MTNILTKIKNQFYLASLALIFCWLLLVCVPSTANGSTWLGDWASELLVGITGQSDSALWISFAGNTPVIIARGVSATEVGVLLIRNLLSLLIAIGVVCLLLRAIQTMNLIVIAMLAVVGVAVFVLVSRLISLFL